jgi:hypothetical protein
MSPIEQPAVAISKPPVSPDQTAMSASLIHRPRVNWTLQSHVRRTALVSSALMAAMAAILVLQPPARPLSTAGPTEPTKQPIPRPAVADSSPPPPSEVRTAPSEPPRVEAPVASEVVPSPSGAVRGTPSSRARDTNARRIPSVLAPSASRAGSAAARLPQPRGTVGIDPSVGAPTAPAQKPVAVVEPLSPPIPSVTAATRAPDAVTSTASPPALDPSPAAAGPRAEASSPAETLRSAPTEVPVNVATRPTRRDLDTRAIENVLGQYRRAFNTLDASAAAAVWPTVNEKTLLRAFERLDAQDVSFESCAIEVGGVHAEASCAGTARYIPKVGSRTPRAEARRWRFILRRTGDGWVIQQIEAR